MAKARTFNLPAELQKAWDWCWNYYCEPSEYDGRTIAPRQSWLTATDLERRLRAAANESIHGEPYGSSGADAWGSRVRISTGTGLSLLETVRDWLHRKASRGELNRHNFGRGHISGMRYRPANLPLTAAEEKTLEAKRKRAAGETPVHFRAKDRVGGSTRPLCTANRNINQRGLSYRSRHNSRSQARVTTDPEQVTCPRCRKLLPAEQVRTLEVLAAFLREQGCSNVVGEGEVVTYVTPNALGAVVKRLKNGHLQETVDGEHRFFSSLSDLQDAWKEGSDEV